MSKVRLIEALAWKRGEMSWPMNLQTLGASRTCSLLCSERGLRSGDLAQPQFIDLKGPDAYWHVGPFVLYYGHA